MRKKAVILAAVAGVLLVASAFYLFYGKNPLGQSASAENELKKAVGFAKTYYEKQFYLPRFSVSGDGSPYDWYTYALIAGLVDLRLKETQPVPEFYQSIDKEIEAAFNRQCGGKGPEECTPRLALLPYCMSKWEATENTPEAAMEREAELSKNAAFAASLKFWGGRFEKNDLTENDLEDLSSFLLAKKACGSISEAESGRFTEKLLRVKIDSTSAKERIHSLNIKAKAFKILLDVNSIGTPEEGASAVDLNIYSDVCSLPSIGEIAGTSDICALREYFKLKSFCSMQPVFGTDEEMKSAAEHLMIQQPTKEKTLCQIGLYFRAKLFLERKTAATQMPGGPG